MVSGGTEVRRREVSGDYGGFALQTAIVTFNYAKTRPVWEDYDSMWAIQCIGGGVSHPLACMLPACGIESLDTGTWAEVHFEFRSVRAGPPAIIAGGLVIFCAQ